MKNTGKFLTFAALALLVPMMAMAQSSSDTASATAYILEPIAVTAVDTLDFGDIVVPAAGNTIITVTTAGVGSGSVANTYLGAAAAGSADVTGAANRAFTASAAASTITNGTDTLNFTPNTTCDAGCNLDGTGALTLAIGGALTVPSTATPGTYNGTFNVTVSYN